MAKYNVHGGHNNIVPGAASILDEVTEDRKVKNKLISLFKSAGHTVYDCTDDSGQTSGANLANIVAKCNKHSVDLDVSIHLNSGRGDTKGDGSTGGVEVFCYDSKTRDVAKKIADAIAVEFGYNKRSDSTTPSGYAGVKYSTGLYVLRNTKSKAILIECCFVDDKDDAKVWNAEKCAAAIYKGITGDTMAESVWKSDASGKYYYENGRKVIGEKKIDGYWYCFDSSSGVMVTGWRTLSDGRKVYYNADGHMVFGKQTIEGETYYLSTEDGKLTVGEVKIGDSWYCFDETGKMITGWRTLSDGRKVYYDEAGRMVFGKRQIDGPYYYFSRKNGAMSTGEQSEEETCWYCFDAEGAMITGWHTLQDGRKVYYDESGRMVFGEHCIDGKVCSFSRKDGSLES